MIVKAYALEQIARVAGSTLDNLRATVSGSGNTSTYRVWNRHPTTEYFNGGQFYCQDGSVWWSIPRGGKFFYYLQQARTNGTLNDVKEYVDPLSATVTIFDRGIFFDDWLEVKIYDLGTLRNIVAREDPKALEQYLPIEVRALKRLEERLPPNLQKRDFEIGWRSCHENCHYVEKSNPVWEAIEKMSNV